MVGTNPTDIVKVVKMTDAEFNKFIKQQEDECNRLYNLYVRGGSLLTISTKPGHIHNAGYGTYTTNVDPKGHQKPWMQQSAKVQLFKQYRKQSCWTYFKNENGIAYYAYLLGKVNKNHAYHWIEVVTHGVDVNDCPTPWEAILKVQSLN